VTKRILLIFSDMVLVQKSTRDGIWRLIHGVVQVVKITHWVRVLCTENAGQNRGNTNRNTFFQFRTLYYEIRRDYVAYYTGFLAVAITAVEER